jgi:hypothetical protein
MSTGMEEQKSKSDAKKSTAQPQKKEEPTLEDVLQKNGLGHFIDSFKKEKITKETLLTADERILSAIRKDLGITIGDLGKVLNDLGGVSPGGPQEKASLQSIKIENARKLYEALAEFVGLEDYKNYYQPQLKNQNQ